MKAALLSMLLLISSMAYGQRVLYFEDMSEVKAVKFYEGQEIEVRLRDYPEGWEKLRIQKLMVEHKTILTSNGMYKLDEISYMRIERRWVSALSNGLKSFSVSGLVLGSLGTLSRGNYLGTLGVVITSAIAYGSGWLINKLFRYRKYKIGKKYRLKMLDLSLPQPIEMKPSTRL